MAERIDANIGKENTEDKEINEDVLITAEERKPICRLYNSTLLHIIVVFLQIACKKTVSLSNVCE